MDIIRTESTEKFVRTAAAWVTGTILQALHDDRSVTIGLSGGSTPQPLYALLATERGIDWKRVTFFLVDERYVPADHKESNQRMIRETLLTHEVSAAKLIVPDTSLSLPDCVKDYGEQIRKCGSVDLVILGMGSDGHTASLFPPVGPEAYGPAKVIHTTTNVFSVPDRISVTFPVLQSAAKRIFLIAGTEKEALLKKMQRENEDVSLYPAQALFDERTTWIVGA